MTAPADGAPPAPRKRDSEFWIAIGALVVSAIAMLSSLVQVNVQRNQERALVWPHVSASPSYSGEGFALVARNKGLGPALVRRVELRVDDKPVANWGALMDTLFGPGHGYDWDTVSANDLEGSIVGAGESVRLFGIGWDERTRAALGSGNRLSASICYCSFLQECWVSRAALDHERVNSCPVH